MPAKIIGPFHQIVTMENLPPAGPIKDEQLRIIENGGVRVQKGIIVEIGPYAEVSKGAKDFVEIAEPSVLVPGFIDSHTHICFAGNRAKDYAARLEGKTYQEIAEEGGGILDTVRKTREASRDLLSDLLRRRVQQQWISGITTCEVKSGYGLTIEDELKQLEVINEISSEGPIELIPTCLAAHALPWEFETHKEYLNFLSEKLLPLLKEKKIASRVDIFIEEKGFTAGISRDYLRKAKELGFSIVVHADQFSRGGAALAAEFKALSADHLESSIEEDFLALKAAGVIPILLPGSSLGLGHPFPNAREILDLGLPLVIASDWNPGSAPMGKLLLQAAVLGAAQKLTMAETLAAITFRAAMALKLSDRAILKPGMRADMAAFPCMDFREILYHQGSLLPNYLFSFKQL